jgi:hypothetical protein
MKKKRFLFLVLSWLSLTLTQAQLKELSVDSLGLVPLPREVKAYEGKFTFLPE